ncbi:hypothetical protein EVAR_67329_1 [Eumeta japonica]|uniref:Uncharacterized protein n=1 Tax=Eumeta variegata TaxID=151549 RepID=A0A4C1ZVW6_EUMVA|nr:hypothetical protein EVAR_67329_1 [Eumeta japonica]
MELGTGRPRAPCTGGSITEVRLRLTISSITRLYQHRFGIGIVIRIAIEIKSVNLAFYLDPILTFDSDPVPTLVFDPTTVLNFSPDPAFDTNSSTSRSSNLNENDGKY